MRLGSVITPNAKGNLFLTLSWRRPISHRNQSINLLCKSMDWFLYDIGLRREKVNRFISFGWVLKLHQTFFSIDKLVFNVNPLKNVKPSCIKTILIHESTNTSLTRVNTSPTRVNTNQRESKTSQHESTRV